MNSGNTDYIRCSEFYAAGGLWSGSEGRYRMPFIALVPIDRYKESDRGPRNVKDDTESRFGVYAHNYIFTDEHRAKLREAWQRRRSL